MEILLTETARLRSDSRQWHLESRNRKGDGKLTGWTKRGSYPRISDLAATAVVDMLLRDGTSKTTLEAFAAGLAAIASSIGAALRPDVVVQKFVELCNQDGPATAAGDGILFVELAPEVDKATERTPFILPARCVMDPNTKTGKPFVVYCSQEGSALAGTLYGRWESPAAFLADHDGFVLDEHTDKRTGQKAWDVVDLPTSENFDDCL